MRNQTVSLISLLVILGLATPVAWSETAIPAKAREHILKHHPQASDFQASDEKHFGHPLIKVAYKDGEETNLELFNSNGTLFSNILIIEDLTPVSSDIMKALKSQFTEYQFKKAELTVNPNDTGEEYRFFLTVNGANWQVTINDKGQVLDKVNN